VQLLLYFSLQSYKLILIRAKFFIFLGVFQSLNLFLFIFFEKRRRQCFCKPGSVLSNALALESVCHLSTPPVARRLKRSTLRRKISFSGGQPSDDGLHELAASGLHSSAIAR